MRLKTLTPLFILLLPFLFSCNKEATLEKKAEGIYTITTYTVEGIDSMAQFDSLYVGTAYALTRQFMFEGNTGEATDWHDVRMVGDDQTTPGEWRFADSDLKRFALIFPKINAPVVQGFPFVHTWTLSDLQENRIELTTRKNARDYRLVLEEG